MKFVCVIFTELLLALSLLLAKSNDDRIFLFGLAIPLILFVNGEVVICHITWRISIFFGQAVYPDFPLLTARSSTPLWDIDAAVAPTIVAKQLRKC